ncbi:MAG: NTP transferase domain-containing protein [Gemmatimonadales bacterium]|jgi:NDP-sugar pyrophosphorylase family protein
MSLTLVILAAGRGTRFGRLKQLEPVGPDGSALMEYTVYDALHAGADAVVLIVPSGEETRFERHARDQLGPSAPVRAVAQRLNDLPTPYTVPPSRIKPWGTGHALLAAAPVVDGPVLVANADDWYGVDAFHLLVRHLRQPHPVPTHALVGYHVAVTLSQHGGVSRAVVETDGDGYLTGVEEIRDVRRTAPDRIEGRGERGQAVPLSGNELVSTGLWGFDASLFGALRESFARFLASSAADPDAEFLIGTGVHHHVASGNARLRVLATDEPWFGMTYEDDAPFVRRRVAELVAAGTYPERLRGS